MAIHHIPFSLGYAQLSFLIYRIYQYHKQHGAAKVSAVQSNCLQSCSTNNVTLSLLQLYIDKCLYGYTCHFIVICKIWLLAVLQSNSCSTRVLTNCTSWDQEYNFGTEWQQFCVLFCGSNIKVNMPTLFCLKSFATPCVIRWLITLKWQV